MLDRRTILAGALAAAGSGAARAADPPAGEALAARLVGAMGGAAAWRRARGLRIAATHYEPQLAGPYDNVLAIALDEPRMRFEGRSDWGMRRVRAIVGDRGWRVSEVSPLGPMTPQQVKGDLDWWEAHPSATSAAWRWGIPASRPGSARGAAWNWSVPTVRS